MFRLLSVLTIGLAATGAAQAQTMTLSTGSIDYQVTPVFSDVGFFTITVEIDQPLAVGAYTDPEIVSVNYQVTGVLEPGTPSGFPAFDLQRSMTGAEFYAQGSSLSFEVAQSAVLDDGVQAAELVGGGIVLTFDGREVDTGRFHPALLELRAGGDGRIQNSNNVPSTNPLVEVGFGEEYLTNLTFDPGNTTLITETAAPPNPGGGGGGPVSPAFVAILGVLMIRRNERRRTERPATGQTGSLPKLPAARQAVQAPGCTCTALPSASRRSRPAFLSHSQDSHTHVATRRRERWLFAST
ncbi:MAG: hypothetical protein WBN65_10735 [Gammaproteobacteria bacterium]